MHESNNKSELRQDEAPSGDEIETFAGILERQLFLY
jgi:hypothetical protein